MDWTRQCAAVIPCLNEAAAIEGVVTQALRHVSTVIVVDDGSTDLTGDLARRAGGDVLRHPQPRGKGAALQTGMQHARQLGLSWVVTLDGDGQHDPADIAGLHRCASQTHAAMVVGNRMADPRGMPWLRRQVNRWMSRRLSRVAGHPLPDTQCGFRLIELEPWSRLTLETSHFEVESEVLLAFVEAGHRVEFAPVRVIYKAEQSKIHPVRDTLRWFRWLGSRQRR